MDPISMALMGGGSLISGLGGILGAGQQASASRAAGNQNAMLQAIAMQQAQQRFGEAQKGLQPYMTGGASAFDLLLKYLQGGAEGIGGGGSSLISNFAPTMERLEQTPGYQFIRSQGLKAAQNSAAGKGLGSSGNALQAGVDYAENLAGTTFQQQLENYLKQNAQAFNMLMGPAGTGAQAANANMTGVTNFNNMMLGAASGVGSLMGAGLMGGANATSNALNNFTGQLGAGLGAIGYLGMRGNPLSSNSVTSSTNFGKPHSLFNAGLAGMQPQVEWAQPYSL